jgi:hypothetical protein
LNKRNYRLVDVGQGFLQTRSPVGAKLARESGVLVTIVIECNAAFAGKPRSNGAVFGGYEKGDPKVASLVTQPALIRIRDQRCPGSGR